MVRHTVDWLRSLSDASREEPMPRHGLRRVLSNIAWLFGDRILRMAVGLVVGVWLARYLGPADFGLLSFALAFVALFGSLATLGLQDVVIREIVRAPSTARVTLGTAFALQLVGGVLACVSAIGLIAWLNTDDVVVRALVSILAITSLFKAAEAVRYWFASQVLSKFVVWGESAVFLAASIARVGLIVGGAVVIAFAWLALAEAVVACLALLLLYVLRDGSPSTWRFDVRVARRMLQDSWPLILSGFAISLYMRIDQVMLGYLVGDEAVGVYSAAVRLSEVWYFIPVAIVGSIYPNIIVAKECGGSFYERRLQQLYDLIVFLAYGVAVPLSFASGWLVVTLYGSAYAEAGGVLAIHVWAGIFVGLGAASGKWLLTEDLPKQVLYRSLIGAGLNIALNSFLIPPFGAKGAAVATIISYFASVFSTVLFPKSRRCAVMMSKALLMPTIRKQVLRA